MADANDPRQLGVEYLPVPLGQSSPPPTAIMPVQFPVVVPAPQSTPWYLDFGGVFRRHWFLMTFAVLLSGAIGYFVGQIFKTNLWTVEGRLRFTAQRSESSRGTGYDSMSLYSYADLFANEELLKPVAAEFADRLPRENPIKYLQKEIKLDTPRMAEQIEIKVDAADAGFGVVLVSKLMERHIEFTNQLRRNAILQSAGKSLEHRIAEATSTVRRLQNACEEYRSRLRANMPIEKLETAELDSFHSQRRKAILEDIEKQRNEIRKTRLGLDAKKLKVNQQRELVERRAIAVQELESSQLELASAEKQLRVDEEQLKRLEERYRMVPVEYAEGEILRLETQKTIAQQDLKLLEAKVRAAEVQQVSLYFVDPADEEWQRLRMQLLGPDNPEFSILKPATAPPHPTVSNRKLLSLLGFCLPFGCIFLTLAACDYWNAARPHQVHAALGGQSVWQDSATNAAGPQEESPLMRARMHQWLNGSIPQRRPNKSEKGS